MLNETLTGRVSGLQRLELGVTASGPADVDGMN